MPGVLAAVAQLLKRDSPTETWPDHNSGRRSKTTASDVIRLPVNLKEYNPEDDSICCPHNCSHCRCSPPSLLYSSASCSSLALTPSTVCTPASLACANDVAVSSSPKDFTLSDGTSLPLEDLDVVSSIIAQRRGIQKFPALKPKPRNASVSSLPGSKNKLLSPDTPDSAAGFAQRIVGFMRLSSRPDPELLPETLSPRDYFEDPFGVMSTSFYEDSYLFDPSPIPHPDLYDFSVYNTLPTSDGTHYYTEKCPKHGKARLYIGVSDIGPPAPITSPASPQQAKARPPAPPVASQTQSTLPAAPPPTPMTPSAPPKPSLRPLLLAQKLAQTDSIVPPTGPKLRPLYLPQHLARRVSHPPRRHLTHSRSNTFPFGPRPSARRSPTDTDAPARGHAGRGRAKSPSQVLQLHGIGSLLGAVSVLEDGHVADVSATATSGSGSEASLSANASTTGPALVLPSADSIPAFALESLGPLSRKVEDILELLSASPSAASRLSVESVVQRGSSICAYAL
ncbi:hypothetical protein K466DRAFT_664741 [Polyporus arcularius HHB13444]|uniref:Uncharacterized protein n=1 Tax=Polyporus arcularius HHB13444 TaxID=1314778 RepID=A0A5C3P838_9APHY|nr:hypothetical protein K466DRAFT_664741 [Polyporus arcularius HHB13444]